MAFPDHLLTLATLRLLTLTPLSSSYSSTSTSTAGGGPSTSSTPKDRFHSVRSQPLKILSELTAAYLQLLGNAAKSHAEQAGRTACNAIDAREAIRQFGGSIEEVDDWARECQLDRGILSSNDDGVLAAAAATTPGGRAIAAGASGDDANDLGALLKDTARNVAYRPPTQVLEYAPLTDREAAIVTAVQHNDSLLPFLPYDLQQQVKLEQLHVQEAAEHSPSPPSSSSRALSSPPPPYNEATSSGALSLRKREKQRAHDVDDDDTNKENDDPLSFLPPFPDLDATQASLQTVIEDESGRIVKRARRALDAYLNAASGGASSKKMASVAWLRAVPYEASSLAEYESGKFSVPSMKKESTSKSRNKRKKLANGHGGNYSAEESEGDEEEEEDALTASSLPYFLETFNWVSLDYEQQGDQALLPLRHNPKRKRAATAIHSHILNPSDDSLSGSIPALPPRHAKKQAGWIPYPPINPDVQDPTEPGGKAIRPFPVQLHPFSTQLPASITEPVPQLVLPHATRVLAPPMHPRYPMAHTSIRTLLESSSPALFGRTTRIGPPGPLLENGAAGYYQIEAEKPVIPGWPGDAMPRMMGWNFDWEIGNELEDGIRERKAAGIQDVALHEDSLSSTKERDINGTTSSINGYSSNVDMGLNAKEEYTGPSFPSLPQRPVYDPQQASLNYQKEQERKIEEEALTFQEVQEDKESERLHALEMAKLAAAEEEERERTRLRREQEMQADAERQKKAASEAAAAAEEEKKRKEAENKPKIVPKLSFSLKLGGASSTSAPAQVPASTSMPSSTQPTSTGAPVPTPAVTESTPANGAHAASADAGAMDFEEIDGNSAVQHASPAAVATSTPMPSNQSNGTGMWAPGTAVEQDYRAPAADITSLPQPPIVLPGTSTLTPAVLSSASVLPDSVEAAPVTAQQAHASPSVTASAAEATVPPAQDEAEQDAEGDEEDGENESEEDALFDEVEVDDQNEGGKTLEGDAVYAASPAYGSAGTGMSNAGEMHVEVEEMDM